MTLSPLEYALQQAAIASQKVNEAIKAQNKDQLIAAMTFADSVAPLLFEVPYQGDQGWADSLFNDGKPLAVGIWTKDQLGDYQSLSAEDRVLIWKEAKPFADYLEKQENYLNVSKDFAEEWFDKLGIPFPGFPEKKPESNLPLILGIVGVGGVIYLLSKNKKKKR